MKTLYVVVGSCGEYSTAHTWMVSAHAKKAEAKQKCKLFNTIAKAAAEWYSDLPDHGQEVLDVRAALNDACGYDAGYDDMPHFSVEKVTMEEHTSLVASHPAWGTILAAMPSLHDLFIQELGKEAV